MTQKFNPNQPITLGDFYRALYMSKSAAQPPMDPAMMGGGGAMPPMDPAMMGGGGAMPPMDQAMMMGGGGAMPPVDPAMLGLPPVAPPAEDPATKKQKPEEMFGIIQAQLHGIQQQLAAIMNGLQVQLAPESAIVPIGGMEAPPDGAMPPAGGAPPMGAGPEAGLPPDMLGKTSAAAPMSFFEALASIGYR